MNTLQTTTNDKDNTHVFQVLTGCKKGMRMQKAMHFF